MKLLLSIILTSLLAVASIADEPNLVGIWHSQDGKLTLEFKRDSHFLLEIAGYPDNSMDGEYRASDGMLTRIVQSQGHAIDLKDKLTLEKDKLTLENVSRARTVVYYREGSSHEPDPAPPANNDTPSTNETPALDSLMQEYSAAIAKKDGTAVAAFILPSDLEAIRNAVLPVFLKYKDKKDETATSLLAAFFGDKKKEDWPKASAVEVFAGVVQILGDVMDKTGPMQKGSLTAVYPTPNRAEVSYRATVKGKSEKQTESLVRKDGKWWVRIKDNPQQFGRLCTLLFSDSEQ